MRLSLAGALALGVIMSVGTAANGGGARRSEGGQIGRRQIFRREGRPHLQCRSPTATVDFYTFSGYRRYHSECHVCHGPNAEGSTYAPALKDSVKRFDYAEFAGIVIGGRENKQAGNDSVMPAFADNKNAMCYLDDLYVYLRARSTDAVEPRSSGEEGRQARGVRRRRDQVHERQVRRPAGNVVGGFG